MILALARGNVLCITPLDGEQHGPSVSSQLEHSNPIKQQLQACHTHHAEHQYTALAWFGHLKQNSSAVTSLASYNAVQQQDQGPKKQATPAYAAKLETAQSYLDPDILLSGTIDGHIQIHSTTGQLLFKQKLMASPVLDILVRPHSSGWQWPAAANSVAVQTSCVQH